ncbi:MAG: ABC transporter permease subunit [Opitutales bacterium]|nr:ABC transporter permease subunit [Opitutales bacterium]
MQKPPLKAVPERFQVAARTLFFDKFMTGLIMIGGISIIVAVFFIFVFIGAKTLPLFRSADIEAKAVFALPDEAFIFLGIDEWREVPYFVSENADIYFVDLEMESKDYENRGTFRLPNNLPDDFVVSHISLNTITDEIRVGSEDGRFTIIDVNYRPTYPADTGRIIEPSLSILPILNIGREGHPILELRYGSRGNRRLAAAIQEVDGRTELHAVTLAQRRGLFAAGELTEDRRFDLTELMRDTPTQILISYEADSILVAYESGEVDYLFLTSTGFSLRQSFTPFEDSVEPGIVSMDFVLGDVSIVVTNSKGEMRVWSVYLDPDTSTRVFGHTKTFPALETPASYFSASRRNKAFLKGSENFASLRFMTTEDIRWEGTLPFNAVKGFITPRYDGMIFLDDSNHLHFWDLDDEHPIAGWTSYFRRIAYEGRQGEIYDWQSSGPVEFERKLSLVPLIIGTMKGTFYAMLVAVPIALLSAIYVSQFLRPSLKRVVKPTMEIMASLPSVVLGFFAALWLSPLISNAVPSVVLGITGLFAGALIIGIGWGRLPNHIRLRIPNGTEFIVVAIPAFVVGVMGWNLGVRIEDWLFLQYDADLEREVGSFRLWVVNTLGMDFETRNAFVVGFAMGFAVIPIIFTISEDALSNVPKSFQSGSLALGASRWQTAIRVILPTAAAGIFSALMIGFGRAIGETMIMVMATGNAVVQDFNPFTGMRTLSANIAVELSEAEKDGTLYRTLFLCAMILFLFTFTLNTIAEVLRQWLRKRFRAVE